MAEWKIGAALNRQLPRRKIRGSGGWSRCAGAVGCVAAAVLYASAGEAHGGIPRAVGIHFAPDDPQQFVVQSDSWGLFVSSDGGQSFFWVCAESYGGDSLGTLHPAMAVAPGGRTVAASFFAGAFVATPSSCDWARVDALVDEVAYDVALTPDGTAVILLAGPRSVGAGAPRLWRSSDSGASWAPFGAALPESFLPASVALIAGDPLRVLVLGRNSNAAAVELIRSDDGGSSWQPPEELPISARQQTPHLVVDPSNGDHWILRLDAVPDSQDSPDPGDRLLSSPDGGTTWSAWLESEAALPGLAFSPDGDRIAVAGPAEGLLIAERARLRVEGAAAFQRVFEGAIWGLAWTRAGLFAGHDEFGEEGSGFSVGVSLDAGATFEPVLRVCDVTLAECDPGSVTSQACSDVYARLAGFEQSILLGPSCARDGGSSSDAGSPVAEAGGGGCGCAIGKRSAGFSLFCAMLLGCCIFALWVRHGSVQR